MAVMLEHHKAKLAHPTDNPVGALSIGELDATERLSSIPQALLSPVFEGVEKNGASSSHPPVFFDEDETPDPDVQNESKTGQEHVEQKSNPEGTPKKFKRKRSRPSTEAKREKRENKRTVYLFPLKPDVSEDYIRGLMADFGGLQLVDFAQDRTSCYARFEAQPMATAARECGEKGGIKILMKLEHLEAIGQLPKGTPNMAHGRKNPKGTRSRRSSSVKSEGGGGAGGGTGSKRGSRATSDADLDTNWRDKDQTKKSGKPRSRRNSYNVEGVNKAKNSPKPSPNSSPKLSSNRKRSDQRWRARSSSGAQSNINGSEEKNQTVDDPRFSGSGRKFSFKNSRRRSESDSNKGSSARVAKGPDGTSGFNWARNPNYKQSQT